MAKGIIVDVGDFSHDIYYPDLQEEKRDLSEEEYYDKMALLDASYQANREYDDRAERLSRKLPTRSKSDEEAIVRGYEKELEMIEGGEDLNYGCDPYYNQEDQWSM